MNNLSWKTCIRAGLTVLLVYLACTYWHKLADVLGVEKRVMSPDAFVIQKRCVE